MHFFHKKIPAAHRGFTLIEMMVSVGLFAVVMLVCVGALLSLVNANRKAQALQSVMNNLNIAVDDMVRSIRRGNTFHGAIGDGTCGGTDYSVTHDCPSGGSAFAFEPYGGDTSTPLNNWVYIFDDDGTYCGEGRLCKSENGGASFLGITASEITIDDMQFFVVGTTRGDTIQPKVVMVVKGSAGVLGSSARTTFHIQATAVQRVLDL